jgi:dienelactone hydrolase
MKKGLLPILLACLSLKSFAQPCGQRYLTYIFSTATQTTIRFDIQPNYLGQADTLLADLYTPNADTETNRALIIFVHGGGFTGGTRDGSNIPYFCQQLAKKGYLVASIDYRLGVSDTSSIQKGKAQIRAIQDLKSFIRFAKQNAATVKLDTNKIFISGSSAGAGTALAAAYLDYNERPSYIDTTGVGRFNGYGNINGKTASIIGVYSLWGAVGDTNWIQQGNVPVGCVQSLYDPCIDWTYIASSCNVPGYPSYGSFSINQRAQNLGIYSTLYGYSSNVHDYGFSQPPLDTTIYLISNFCYNVLCGFTSSIQENHFDNSINVYPNPFTTKIQIENSNFDYQYLLYNFSGQLLKQGRCGHEIKTDDIPVGVYFLKLFNEKSYKTIKLIKSSN